MSFGQEKSILNQLNIKLKNTTSVGSNDLTKKNNNDNKN